eukprot:GHVS01029126.1.p1 GENE.GHVS01029126.1~~GHVS01029126.1.p1  ORF type:complete len:771 (+),score=215.76 GHVS01029126.1:130-2313(+)
MDASSSSSSQCSEEDRYALVEILMEYRRSLLTKMQRTEQCLKSVLSAATSTTALPPARHMTELNVDKLITSLNAHFVLAEGGGGSRKEQQDRKHYPPYDGLPTVGDFNNTSDEWKSMDKQAKAFNDGDMRTACTAAAIRPVRRPSRNSSHSADDPWAPPPPPPASLHGGGHRLIPWPSQPRRLSTPALPRRGSSRRGAEDGEVRGTGEGHRRRGSERPTGMNGGGWNGQNVYRRPSWEMEGGAGGHISDVRTVDNSCSRGAGGRPHAKKNHGPSSSPSFSSFSSEQQPPSPSVCPPTDVHNEEEENGARAVQFSGEGEGSSTTPIASALTVPEDPIDVDGDHLRRILHEEGRCKPCAFFYNKRKGCRHGDSCEFCHHVDHSKLTLKQWKKQQRRMQGPESEKGDSDIDDEELPCLMSATTTTASCPASPPRPSSSAPSSPTATEAPSKETSMAAAAAAPGPPGNSRTSDLVKLVESLLSSSSTCELSSVLSAALPTDCSGRIGPPVDAATSTTAYSRSTSQTAAAIAASKAEERALLEQHCSWCYFPTDPVVRGSASPANICPTLSDFVHLMPPSLRPSSSSSDDANHRGDTINRTLNDKLTTLVTTTTDSILTSSSSSSVVQEHYYSSANSIKASGPQTGRTTTRPVCTSSSCSESGADALFSVNPLLRNVEMCKTLTPLCPSNKKVSPPFSSSSSSHCAASHSASAAACLGLELQQHLAALLQDQ